MKFGHEYEMALANEGFPPEWVQSAIEYKHLKKCIKRVHYELEGMGLDVDTLHILNEWVSGAGTPRPAHEDKGDFFSAVTPQLSPIAEEFNPQLRILVDSKTAKPLDARLAPETKLHLQRLAKHETVLANRRKHLPNFAQPTAERERQFSVDEDAAELTETTSPDARWVQVPLASAKDFFEMLEPKLVELEALRDAETHNLEDEILDLGDLVEDVVMPVREGYEAKRDMSYRDLYFWREMFRLYLQKPIFYSETERRRGAITFGEAKSNLEEFDRQLRETGLLGKMRTPQAKAGAKKFLDVNVQILKVMHFQEMNARAMTKILKKFDKQTHLEGQRFIKDLRTKYPLMLTSSATAAHNTAGGFADSIARDLQAEMATKVLAIVPQLDDWICPVCYGMAWRPVNLGCCRSVFCIRCIIQLQDQGMKRCPMCNAETVLKANGTNIDFETMEFLQIYFPMEVKKRQKENEKAQLVRDYGEEFVKPSCSVM